MLSIQTEYHRPRLRAAGSKVPEVLSRTQLGTYWPPRLGIDTSTLALEVLNEHHAAQFLAHDATTNLVPLSPGPKFRRGPAEFLVWLLDQSSTVLTDHASARQRPDTLPIRVVCTSDTHNTRLRVPYGDSSTPTTSQINVPSRSSRPRLAGSYPCPSRTRLSLTAAMTPFWRPKRPPAFRTAPSRWEIHACCRL